MRSARAWLLRFGQFVLLALLAALVLAWPRIRRDVAELPSRSVAPPTDASDTVVTSAAPPSPLAAAEPRVGDTVVTPAPGSRERAAILEALRSHLKTRSRFKVDHIRIAGALAFVRATEIVKLEGDEEQETDLTVAALLEKPPRSTTGWWRIADIWTLPDNEAKPLADFSRRVKQRITAERLPLALLPEDF